MQDRWTTIVDAETFLAHLDDPDLVILDCRHTLTDAEAGPTAYADAHVPGALHAHIDRDLSGPVGARTGRHPLPDPKRLRETFGRWGIGPDAQVVAYDESGGAWAARAWWLLRYYGHNAVAVLDGGLPAYLLAGGTLTDEPPATRHQDFLGSPGHLPTIDAASIEPRLPVAAGALLDARDPERYRGEVEPIDPEPGHIPGAVNVPFKGNLAPDGRFRAPDELLVLYREAIGGRDASEVAAYCGSGVTAAHDLLAMEVAGLRGAALYPGSWSEWCSDPARAVERTTE